MNASTDRHLDSYVSPKTGKVYPIAVGKGYRRGCRCSACTEEHKVKKQAERERRLAKPVPDHVHGTWNGYANYNCRCAECLQALRDTTYEYSAEYRELNRERIRTRRKNYYHEGKAAQLAADLKRRKAK